MLICFHFSIFRIAFQSHQWDRCVRKNCELRKKNRVVYFFFVERIINFTYGINEKKKAPCVFVCNWNYSICFLANECVEEVVYDISFTFLSPEWKTIYLQPHSISFDNHFFFIAQPTKICKANFKYGLEWIYFVYIHRL